MHLIQIGYRCFSVLSFFFFYFIILPLRITMHFIYVSRLLKANFSSKYHNLIDLFG